MSSASEIDFVTRALFKVRSSSDAGSVLAYNNTVFARLLFATIVFAANISITSRHHFPGLCTLVFIFYKIQLTQFVQRNWRVIICSWMMLQTDANARA